ncbi:MAG: enoyl-CoA hydratase/isomerase family protein, partial [Gaiellaceae bacterium]
MTDAVLLEKQGPLALITLNRPQAMNALDVEANDALVAVWEEYRDDDELQVAIISGAGEKAFCSGADLKAYTPLLGEMSPHQLRVMSGQRGFGGITRSFELYKPVVAAINGYAISGGLELALACDIRICAPHAEFGSQEVRWGFHHCDGGNIRLPLIVGLGNALRMTLTGERIDADEAHRIGLVSDVVEASNLLEEAERIATLIAANSPLGVRSAKETTLRSIGRTLEDALHLEHMFFASLAKTEDYIEG